jgi:hypothetical protein
MWLGLFAVFIALMFLTPPQTTGFATSYTPAQRTAWGSMFGSLGAGGLIFVWLAISRKSKDLSAIALPQYPPKDDEDTIFKKYKYKSDEFVDDVVLGVGRSSDEKIAKVDAYPLLKRIGSYLQERGVSKDSVDDAVSYVSTAVGEYTDVKSMVRMVMGYAIKMRERPSEKKS